MKILCFLLFFHPIALFGQATPVNNTHEDVSQWLDSVKTLPLTLQLKVINQRISGDTNTYVRHKTFVCRGIGVPGSYIHTTPVTGSKTEVSCKPIYVVGRYPFMDNYRIDHPIWLQLPLVKRYHNMTLSLNKKMSDAAKQITHSIQYR